MNEHDDLERLISGSLASRSERAGTAAHSLDDVHRRVDLRRGRRRHVAAFGATAVLAAGAFALTAIGSSDPSVTPLVPADAVDQADVRTAWRCTGQLDVTDDQGASYFAHCEQVTADDSVSATIPLYPTTTIVWYDCSPTSSPAVTDPCGTTPVQEVTHRVGAGETLASISAAYGITIEEIVAVNPWGGRTDVTLVEGETIVIALRPIWPPPPTEPELMPTTTTIAGRSAVEQEHTIRSGDSLASIADLYGITIEQLINYNQFDDGADHVLLPGDRLLVPPAALVPAGIPTVPTSTSTP